MTRWPLAALTIPALAALATAAPPAAQAQDWLDESPPAVRSIANELRRACLARGRTPIISGDFLFGLDADWDGEADDVFLTDAGYSCLTRAQLAGAGGGHGGSGMQWLLVKGRGPLRLVWRGRTPGLYVSAEHGLVASDRPCERMRCARYVWNGQSLAGVRGGAGGR